MTASRLERTMAERTRRRRKLAALDQPGIPAQRLLACRHGPARGRHDHVGDGLDEEVGPGGVGRRVGDGVVDVEQDLGLGARDGHAAVAAEGVEDAADELDLGLA